MALLLESGGYILREDGGLILLESDTYRWPPEVNATNFGNTYTETPNINIAEFQPPTGATVRRRRMSILTDTIAFSLIMTAAEYASFLFFYKTTLVDGVLPFSFPRPRTGATETWTFTTQASAMKFVDYGLYEVSMTLRNVP